jgi:branched-chain amino acid transport system ATP-binding protein
MSATMLEVNRLVCTIGGVRAVDGVDLTVREGGLSGIVGPNGAGKTTLFNAITGFVPSQSGDVLWRGRSIRGWKPHRIANDGLARTFQNAGGLAGMTVLENITLAARRSHSGGIDEVCELLSLDQDRGKQLEDCSLATRKLVGIAMAVVRKPTLLLLDEPLSGLDLDERDAVVETIKRVNAQGVAILMIEHDIDRTLALVDHISILDLGQVVAHGAPSELSGKPELHDVYLKA